LVLRTVRKGSPFNVFGVKETQVKRAKLAIFDLETDSRKSVRKVPVLLPEKSQEEFGRIGFLESVTILQQS
jgi:predicted GH43/DUF377 family glycosyl hydrolase